jgi:hypothetical protein
MVASVSVRKNGRYTLKRCAHYMAPETITGRYSVASVDEFVTKTMPHTEVNEAFHLMHEGKTLRSVITFPHAGDAEVAAHRAEHLRGAIVFLHGLGDKPSSWEESVQWLAGKINAKAIKTVCPAAPTLAITKNDGERMTAWCDVYEPWPLTTKSRDDTKGLEAVCRECKFIRSTVLLGNDEHH